MRAQVIAVLGMCHSGTSCLAESLVKSGVHFGSDLRGAVYEHRRITNLHASMLRWDDPSRVKRELKHEAERDAIVATMPTVWGFKEPLTLFTTAFWREKVDLKPIGTFRDPRKVATRFARQFNAMKPRLSELYCTYNRKLLEEHDRAPFPLLCFDDSSEEYDVQLYTAFRRLGLQPPPSPDLSRRKTQPDTPVSKEALALYDELRGRVF